MTAMLSHCRLHMYTLAQILGSSRIEESISACMNTTIVLVLLVERVLNQALEPYIIGAGFQPSINSIIVYVPAMSMWRDGMSGQGDKARLQIATW